jgi:hypothetical protein
LTIRKLKEELPTGLAGQLEWPKTLRREFEQPVLESKLTAHIQNNLKSFRRLLKYAQDNKASEADFLLCDQTALAIESKDNLSKANDTIYLLWRAKGIVEFGVAASLQTFAAEEDPGCNWLVRAFEEIGGIVESCVLEKMKKVAHPAEIITPQQPEVGKGIRHDQD